MTRFSENAFLRNPSSFLFSHEIDEADDEDGAVHSVSFATRGAEQAQKTKRDVPTSSASPISPSSELFYESAQRCASCPTRAFLLESLVSATKEPSPRAQSFRGCAKPCCDRCRKSITPDIVSRHCLNFVKTTLEPLNSLTRKNYLKRKKEKKTNWSPSSDSKLPSSTLQVALSFFV